MTALFNFLAPILFVLAFYLLLGLIIWWIFNPPRLRLRWRPHGWRLFDWQRQRPKWLPGLTDRVPKDPVSRQTLRFALPLGLLGLLGLLLPLALPWRLIAAQAVGLAFLLPWFDNYFTRRQSHAAMEALLSALRSPLPHIATAAVAEAQQRGWFTNGTLRGLDFRHAQWAGSDLSHADLRRVNLAGADLHGALFHHAQLERVILTGANLATADFAGASLVEAQLNQISAKAATFRSANCLGVNLDGAKLQRADFAYANLSHSALCQTNFKQAALVGVQLTGARFDALTRWPKHFYPELSGAKRIEALSLPSGKLAEHSEGHLR